MISIEEIGTRLLRAEKEIERLKRTASKPSKWVKVGAIQEVTGWNKERLRRARVNGEVEMRRRDGEIWYNISSIHPVMIKAKQ
jgi:hypothetical protein